MTARIINLGEYRKAKAAQEVRKAVNDYFSEHSQMMAWLLSELPRPTAGTGEQPAVGNASARRGADLKS